MDTTMDGKIIRPSAYRDNKVEAEDDLALLERDIGEVEITPGRIRIGRLLILFCAGWMKVELMTPDHDSEAELLPPADAAVLKNWIRNN